MQPGAVIAGRYRLEALIGAGAMGQVWRARDQRLHRAVALKLVDLSQATGPVTADQFGREVLATARLNHPNIVTTFDGGTDGDLAFLVMELLSGESLADRLRRGPLPAAEAARVASEVAKALDATHLIGVVHRDIKPGNVMLTPAGGVKVLDFGIARLTGDTDAEGAAEVVGTAAYMSPEQVSNRPVGPASDLYALGCLLFAMLTGRAPFTGPTALSVAQQQLGSPPPTVRSLRPEAPAGLEALVAALLAKDPAARPDAAAVTRTLAPWATGASEAVTAAFPPPTGPPHPADSPPSASPRPADPAHPTAVLGGASGVHETSVLPSEPPVRAVGAVPATRPVPVGQRGVAPVSPPEPPRRWFRRVLRWILLGIVALVLIGAASVALPRLAGLVTGGPPGASPSTAKATAKASTTPSPTRKATPTPTQSRSMPGMPTMPSIPLPTMPSLPSAGQAALQAALDGVASTLDSWTPADSSQTKAKAKLVQQWTKASAAIAAGKDPQGALDDFTANVVAAHDDGTMPTVTYGTLRVALQAVSLLV